jgi:hypothetical protein
MKGFLSWRPWRGITFSGRMVNDGPVFDRFCDALYVMNEWIRSNQQLTGPSKWAELNRLKAWSLFP